MPYSERIELEVVKIKFSGVGAYESEPEPPSIIHACGELAQILRTVVGCTDIIVISGGYEILYERKMSIRSVYNLNFRGRDETRIFRICSIPAEVRTLHIQ